MKRILLSLFLVCCTLALSAQEAIRVSYRGARPTISDFVSAFITTNNEYDEEGEYNESLNAFSSAWQRHLKGLPMESGEEFSETLTADERNGYVCYERRQEDGWLLRWEACYWNESDGRHKLFAYNVSCFKDGHYSPGQYDGTLFYRYDNATKTMTWCEGDLGFERRFSTDDGDWISYALPRTGKDITVTTWYKSGPRQKTLHWKGRKFSY
ncbi:MAG: hypothetical protein IJQ13_05335 [Prevotella sp.]|nr:hypothetical protein [Prevotella sp.]